MVIKPEIVEIGEKIRAVFVPTGNFKTNIITASLTVPREKNLAANIVLSRLLAYSSAKYPDPIMLNAHKEMLYGTSVSGVSVKSGESARIELSADFIDSKLTFDGEDLSLKVMSLISELLFNPDCRDGKFDREKFLLHRRLAIEIIDSEQNDKRAYALQRMFENMCADEVFGISSAEIRKDLEALDEADIYNAWKELLSTATVQFNFVGTFDRKKALEIIRQGFAGVDRHPVENSTLFVERAEDVTEVTETMDINQSKLVLGFRNGMTDKDDDFYARQMMTDIFGGGAYSRLFMNVREKLSLCYYCSARMFRNKGVMAVQSGIEKENRQKVLDEILAQLEVMKKGEFTDGEFESSKKAICDSLRGAFDTPEGIDLYLSLKSDSKIDSIEETIEKYEKVTREDIVRAANDLTLDTVYMLEGRDSGDDE